MGLKREILASCLDRLIAQNWPKKSYLQESRSAILDMYLRPETFMWALVSDVGIVPTLQMIGGMNSGFPNMNHLSIASLLKARTIKAVVTTNFDTYIERSLDAACVKHKLIRDLADLREQDSQSRVTPLVFKPHGCLSKPSSMSFRIDQIQRLPNEMGELLEGVLRSGPVLVVGYSGNDEDIFPLIQRVLPESQFKSYICVFPDSAANEPIQTWDVRHCAKIVRFFGDPMTLLNALSVSGQSNMNAPCREDSHDSSTTGLAHWRNALLESVKEIPHDVIAMTVSHLCGIHGDHHRSLSFANLAQDICEDTELSRAPRESLMFIKELQSRAYKEIGLGDAASNLEEARLRQALEGSDYREVIEALLERAHVSLRENELDAAERDLGLVGVHLRRAGVREPEKANHATMSFLWYSGILERKQGRGPEADMLFNQALAVAKAHDDIIHAARILLDHGYARCQMKDWDSAQQMWGLAVALAERSNDWDTAAKAAKNRGILLSVSDSPEGGRLELQRSRMLFERAGDHEGAKRATEALGYTAGEFILAALGFGSTGERTD